jgi:hypothetical protein
MEFPHNPDEICSPMKSPATESLDLRMVNLERETGREIARASIAQLVCVIISLPVRVFAPFVERELKC